jgi:DNA-binding NtrC family response regulator
MHEKITLLIVEDDESLSASLEKSFRKHSYDVLCAAEVSEAKRILHAQKIDLILLDIQLPDASGLEVLHSALEIDSEILVIMMTAFPEIKTAVRTLKEGAYDFIVKPFELEGLREAPSRRHRRNSGGKPLHRVPQEPDTEGERGGHAGPRGR